MLQKFLMIGVGGSGGKTIRYTWRELNRVLEAARWKGDFPAAWQFLHVDCPQIPDVVEGDVPVDIGGADNYLGMASFPQQYADCDRELCDRIPNLDSVAGWRPDPDLEYPPPYRGAGQRRVVGRVVTLTELDQIDTAVQNAIDTLGSANTSTQLDELNRHMKFRDTVTQADPATAIVVSSLGGGSGSGAFLDIVEQLRRHATRQAQWLNTSLVTVLYAADVFSGIPKELRTGVEPNTLAALSELLAAYEHQGPVSDLEDQLLTIGGGTVPIRDRRIGRTNFIIGSRNSNLTFEDSHDVYRSVGKAFATFLSDNDVQKDFIRYVITNPSAETVTSNFRVTDLDAQDRPCASFGYANVSLGRNLFKQYAAERLAAQAVDKMLYAHRNDDDVRPDELIVPEKAAQNKDDFFLAAGLYEQGEDRNQVLDAFRDPDEQDKGLTRLGQDVRTAVKKDGSKLAPMEWFARFTSTYDEFADAFQGQARDERKKRATEWVSDIQARLLSATAESVGSRGLPVTIELLDLLSDQLLDAASELEGDRVQLDKDLTSALGFAKSVFDRIHDKVITAQNKNFGEASKKRREALRFRLESSLYAFTAEVLRDLVENLIPPLRKTLVSGHEVLRLSVEEADHKLVSQWSTGAVPPHLEAAPNEILLESQDKFDEQFEEIVVATTGSEDRAVAPETAIDRAIVEVLSGAWPSVLKDPSTPQEQSMLGKRYSWSCSVEDARDQSDPPRSAEFSIDLRAPKILGRAEDWVAERSGAISLHTSETLTEWLDPSHRDNASRGDRFADAFDQALKNSEPLVSINSQIHRQVHGTEPASPTLVMSRIPLGKDHPARARLEATFAAMRLSKSDIDKKFSANAKVKDVQITSFVARAVHPVVMDSLMDPVQQDWLRRTDRPKRTQFWSFRRSRPLTSFIPVSPMRQITLIRGWQTATILGHVGRLKGRWSNAPLAIWTPRGPRKFPTHLLGGDVTEHKDVLGALLESMPLAMVAFASGHPAELEAYMRLLDLGAGEDQQEDLATIGVDLENWIVNGEKPKAESGFGASPVPQASRAGEATGTPMERGEVIAGELRAFGEKFQSTVAGTEITRETSLTVPRTWELRDRIVRATFSLADAVEATARIADPGDDGEGGVGLE